MIVLGHKEPELIIAYLGAIKSGRAYVPVDTAVPPQRIERIAAASGAPVILTPETIAEFSSGQTPAPPVAARNRESLLYHVYLRQHG